MRDYFYTYLAKSKNWEVRLLLKDKIVTMGVGKTKEKALKNLKKGLASREITT
jgi:hypothetical protein